MVHTLIAIICSNVIISQIFVVFVFWFCSYFVNMHPYQKFKPPDEAKYLSWTYSLDPSPTFH